MITFESTLQQLLEPYAAALLVSDEQQKNELKNRLIGNAFQATGFEHSARGSTYQLPGPRLYLLQGMESTLNPQKTQYVDRQGRETYAAQDNGMIELAIVYGQEAPTNLAKMVIDFRPRLLLPAHGIAKPGFYTLLTEER